MKNILALSIVLYGEEYISKFFNISFKTVIQNLNNLSKEFRIKFIISTDNKSIKKIKSNILSKINADIEFLVIKNKNIKYYSVTQEQLQHLKIAKDQNIKYLFFLYADIIFSKYSFKNSIKYLIQNRKLKAICSFALLLNAKNVNFKNFFYYLLKKEKDHLKLLINNKDIIDKYHQTFEKNILNFNKSFFYLIKNKNLYLKTFHYHPIVVTPLKINTRNILNLEIHTLDNQFIENFFSINEIYIEQDLKKISLFSFDVKSRHNVKSSQSIKLSNKYFKEIDNILLSISAYEKGQLENKLFMNNTISCINNNSSPISIKNDFFDKEIFLKNCNFFKNKKSLYRDQIFIEILSKINNSGNNINKNFFFIFFYFILFLILATISYNKSIFKIYIKLKNIFIYILGNKQKILQNNFNEIYASMYFRLVLIYFKKRL
jgi:hypothetical protein